MALITSKEKHPQIDDRKLRVYTDEHGRKWEAIISKKTDHPVSPLKPRGWRAPVKGGQTPDRYIRFSTDDENVNQVTIDYDQLIGAYKDAFTEWRGELVRRGRQMLGTEFDADNPSPAVLDVVGPQPFPWQYWQACRDPQALGHAWALGLDDERPAWADLYFAPKAADDAFLYGAPMTPKASAPKPRRVAEARA